MNKKTVSLLLGLGVDPVVLGCSSGCVDFSIFRELGLLNGRHFDVVRLEE